MRSMFILSLLIIFHLWLSSTAFAFKFNPMSQEIALDQKQKRAVYTIDNDSEKPIAVEISLKKRLMKADGSEEHGEIEDNLISVFPEQIIIPPKDKRTIRVTWNSKDLPPYEQAFRVIAEQLPVNLNPETKEVGIKMLLRYIAALYVNPGKTKPDLDLEKVVSSDDSLEIHLRNKGSQHQILNIANITFEKADQKIVLDRAGLQSLQGENVLAQSTRIFRIKKDDRTKNIDKSYKATLSFDE